MGIVQTHYPGTLTSLAPIGAFVLEHAAAAGLDRAAAYRLRLAVDEIATNIVLHGYEEAGRSGPIDVSAKLDTARLTIILEDDGEPFDPTSRSLPDDLDAPLEEREIGGLGVFLAIEGVDEFRYERAVNRNRNMFIVKRPSAA